MVWKYNGQVVRPGQPWKGEMSYTQQVPQLDEENQEVLDEDGQIVFVDETDENGDVVVRTDTFQHPKQWFEAWSDAEKVERGLVWEDDPEILPALSSLFYWGRDNEGNPMPKNLDDVNEVDAEGNPLLDDRGNQIVTYGLKTTAIRQVKHEAAGLLQNTDWYVTRKSEADTAIPENVVTYRSAVRTKSGEIEALINGCTTLEALMALYDTPVDEDMNPTGNPPIHDWPEDPTSVI